MATTTDDYGNYDLTRDGLTILRVPSLTPLISRVKALFEAQVFDRFTEDPELNRSLIRRFVDSPAVSSVFCHDDFQRGLKEISSIESPCFCGPTVSHYTDNSLTGGGYGLPLHVDFPSMASSARAVICWFALDDCSEFTHGLQFYPGMHNSGLPDGCQTDKGFLLDDAALSVNAKLKVLNVRFGDVAVFTPFTPHATHVSAVSTAHKLSISTRFDCFNDQEWLEAGLPRAYGVSVDRELYRSRLSCLSQFDRSEKSE